jgi:hypothetical protein
MPYDGFGNFTRSYSWAADKLAAIKIQAARMDGEFDNYATALNSVILRNGVAAMTGNFKLGGNLITGIGAGSAAAPSMSFSADATTGFYFPAAGVVAISAAGVERARANNTGFHVPAGQLHGVGTNTPRTALDVVGLASFRSQLEDTLISATAISGTVNIDAFTQALIMLTSNASGNFAFNIRGDATNALNTLMAVGQTLTIAIEVPQGVTAYYCTAIQVDGVAQTVKWSNGGAPTAGNVSGVDVYAIRITKLGSATWAVRASQSQEK